MGGGAFLPDAFLVFESTEGKAWGCSQNAEEGWGG